MKCFFFLAAFAASANGLALFGRAEQACCFHLNVTGEVTGPLGQLTDGQSRVGDHSLNQSTFCINSTGVITDSTGKGCIITPETTQFQCDEGKAGTPGFSISSSGQLQFHGSDYFIACETGQNGGKNIYTTNSTSVTRCKAVYLNADSCINAGSVPVVSIPPAPGSNVTGPGGAAASGVPGAPGAPGASAAVCPPVTIISTVTVSNCVCSATAAPGAPGAPAAPGQASSASSPAASGASSQTSAAPAGSATAAVPIASAPGHSSVSSASTTAPTGGAASASSATASATASAHTSVVPVVPVPGQSSATSASTASASETSHASGATSTHPSTPCPSCSKSASASGGSATSSPSPCPSCSHSATSGTTGASTPCPSCQSAGTSTAHATTPCPSCPQSAVTSSSLTFSVTSFANSTHISSVPATSPATTPSTSIHPVNSTSTSATSTSTSTSCPTNLSGEFQFPHLIVRIDSAKPDTPHGTGLNGTVNATVATTFNFDIPQSYSGKTCSLIFLFPRKEELQTTSFSFSGDGKVAFGKLSQTITSSTTENNVPSVSQGLGTITISPGNSFLLSTFSCPAGQAVSFEMKNAGTTNFEFFEDWNPSPLGLFITAC